MAGDAPRALKAGEKITESWIASLVRSIGISLGLSVAWPLEYHSTGAGGRLSLAWYFEQVLFELDGTLTKGGHANATRLIWNSQSERYELPSASEQTDSLVVYDMIGTFTGDRGKRGYCFFSRTSGRWEIVQLEC